MHFIKHRVIHSQEISFEEVATELSYYLSWAFYPERNAATSLAQSLFLEHIKRAREQAYQTEEIDFSAIEVFLNHANKQIAAGIATAQVVQKAMALAISGEAVTLNKCAWLVAEQMKNLDKLGLNFNGVSIFPKKMIRNEKMIKCAFRENRSACHFWSVLLQPLPNTGVPSDEAFVTDTLKFARNAADIKGYLFRIPGLKAATWGMWPRLILYDECSPEMRGIGIIGHPQRRYDDADKLNSYINPNYR